MAKTQISQSELMEIIVKRGAAFDRAAKQLGKCRAGDVSSSSAGAACDDAAKACAPEYVPGDDEVRSQWEATARLVRKPEQDWVLIDETSPAGVA